MQRISLLDTAHAIVREHLKPGGTAIDATMGNGHDTVFLAQCVGEQGRIFGFDIQFQALANTRQRLQLLGLENRAILFHASHAEMRQCLPANTAGLVQAIMFNLGYLPGTDKTIITQTQSTLAGLNAACCLLAEYGVITVLAYPGHPGGGHEMQGLADWSLQLNRRVFQFEIIQSKHHQDKAPQLFVLRKQSNLL